MVLELLPALLELAFYGTGSVALAVAGFYVERFALLTARGGEPTVGAWAAVLGLAMLALGYLLATDKVGPRLRDLRREVDA